MSTIKVTMVNEEDELLVGQFEPKEIQPIIDLFLAHNWINPDGNELRATNVSLLVHDFTTFQVELA